MTAWLTIIGMGEGGSDTLPEATRRRIDAAPVLIGSRRFLSALPQPEGQERIAWSGPYGQMLGVLDARRGMPTVLLATGDPFWFGIGASLSARYGSEEFETLPAPSAYQLAASRLVWPLQNVTTLSLHGRPVEALHPHVLPGNRILALTADAATAGAVACLLLARGYGQSLMIALEAIGGPGERREAMRATEWDKAEIGDFYVLAIDCVADADAPLLPPIPGLPDGAFISDGQLTKREVRAATLARLAPYPGALLWDLGAGCGSIGIEWMRAAPGTRAIAFERETERLSMIARNAAALGVPALTIVPGDLPETLAGQDRPDAVFVGGGVGNPTLFERAWDALRPGGRLVANAVTLEGELELSRRQAELGGDLVRIDVSVLDRVGPHRVMRPRMAVTQFSTRKP
ncbi:precorrin-6y C5,15-methyltransferase (decarboxylating) subunit CbiE [Arsenicitalea aurantiaca]|uniref:Precorrin-6y C5,15-methyltransferase (Decarboxylating) subunit CbiE n=1 Tax=Arsenicitalea aurantiaca TaxID=1783274 RepID=A0A433X3Z9_9HYPH|nr:precorrin-6y C5,15-methyltransferase (decarboxylating) subunit CbiE [Arsenicitalea aurantiaca]RUT28782.1 precorrin-6y C5,15-methyltransferase (decarboxylating) subunit CbiE [Arsenicitalea aurantiaca]